MNLYFGLSSKNYFGIEEIDSNDNKLKQRDYFPLKRSENVTPFVLYYLSR